MRPEVVRLRRSAVAAWDLLGLDLRVLTANRGLVLAIVELAVFAFFAIVQRFQDEPWDLASFYNRTVVLPALLPAVALGMAAVMSERDGRHLEVTFALPGGRYQVWAYRLAGLFAFGAVSCLGLSVLTWAFVDTDHPVLAAALHAVLPVTAAGVLVVFLTVLFNGAAAGALVSTLLLAGSGVVLQERLRRFNPFLNPFNPPTDLLDPATWARLVAFNRCFLVVVIGLAVAGTLGLLQRRERLI